jgi:hypothetical protein
MSPGAILSNLGDLEMQLGWIMRKLTGRRPVPLRRARKVFLACDPLEGRITPAHGHVAHHVAALVHAHHHHSATTTSTSTGTSTSTSATSAASNSGTSTGSSTSTSTGSSTSTSTGSGTSTSSDGSCDGGSQGSSSNSAVSTALTTLRNDVLSIEQGSGTTVGELAAIRAAFNTLENDGLTPSSESALRSFEDSLVTAFASGTTLANNSTLLSQFESLYTSSPTTQQTTDLTTAYNALAAAVTSSGITSANITTINNDWSALLSAEGSTSTATYPYFNLVTGQGTFGGHDGGFGGDLGGWGDH